MGKEMQIPDWQSPDGRAKLFLGDCLKILPTLPKVDSVITDPPYGDMATHGKHLSSVTLKKGESRQVLGFDGITKDTAVELARSWVEKANRWVVFTCEWKYAHALDEAGLLVRLGIWRKPDGAPQFTGDRPGTGWEAVAVCHRPGRKRWNGGGSHAFWQWPKGQNETGHPTGKPLGLFLDFVNDFTDQGETILDPYMGSGTTGVACVRLGRQFIGIEKEERYFKIAVKRIIRELEQGKLPFAEPEKYEHAELFTLNGSKDDGSG